MNIAAQDIRHSRSSLHHSHVPQSAIAKLVSQIITAQSEDGGRRKSLIVNIPDEIGAGVDFALKSTALMNEVTIASTQASSIPTILSFDIDFASKTASLKLL